jgi:hypothetical protein
MTPADLKIRLKPLQGRAYPVELEFRPADSAADTASCDGVAAFDKELLTDRAVFQLGPQEYGERLFRGLFGDDNLEKYLDNARATLQTPEAAMRVRLRIDSGAKELHALKWELLRDPRSGRVLATDESTWFSRYLVGEDPRAVLLNSRQELSALVAVASPADGKAYGLDDIDPDLEIRRVQAALGEQIRVAVVRGPETMQQLAVKLQEDYDILYLVCHGKLHEGEALLWLEGAPTADGSHGQTARTPGYELVERVGGLLEKRPRLIVLVSCQSAGHGDRASPDGDGFLAALGPRLADVGVPAVVAMQGDLSMETAEWFVPAFFEHLRVDGQIDRAVAVARGMVRKRDDHWMPALFLRLSDGKIWEGSGAGAEAVRWKAILLRISEGRCTPVLGPGLLEDLVGLPREIARQWARTEELPLTPDGCDNLALVSQCLKPGDPELPYSHLRDYQHQEILKRYRTKLPADLQRVDVTQVGRLVKGAGQWRRLIDPAEPHAILARLPFSVYLTANPDDLLSDSLREEVKEPQVVVCPWKSELKGDAPPSTPDKDHPLVCHLHGRLDTEGSLVLTEDDHFDYLIGIALNKSALAPSVRRAMGDSLLLFLGFEIDHWSFRGLLRCLPQLGDRGRPYPHVAVQVDPEKTCFVSAQEARDYLQTTFAVRGLTLSVSWMSAKKFLAELAGQWQQWRARGTQS